MAGDRSLGGRTRFNPKPNWIGFGIIAAIALLSPSGQAIPTQSEYALKSAFLYNFCRFIDWPESAFSSANDPFIIGIAGDDPFGSLLNDTIKGKKYRNHPIRIDYFRGAGEIKRCHLLFVPRANASRFDPSLTTSVGKNILTVSETDEFLNRGGMITLRAEPNRVRLRISRAAVHSANLVVSSKLLKVAEVKP